MSLRLGYMPRKVLHVELHRSSSERSAGVKARRVNDPENPMRTVWRVGLGLATSRGTLFVTRRLRQASLLWPAGARFDTPYADAGHPRARGEAPSTEGLTQDR